MLLVNVQAFGQGIESCRASGSMNNAVPHAGSGCHRVRDGVAPTVALFDVHSVEDEQPLSYDEVEHGMALRLTAASKSNICDYCEQTRCAITLCRRLDWQLHRR